MPESGNETRPASSSIPVNPPDERTGIPGPPQPPDHPALRNGVLGNLVSLARYLLQTEVHTYAFSVAACAVLTLFPFIVMMYTLARKIFHSPAMVNVVSDLVWFFLPAGQQFVIRNMNLVAITHPHVQFLSLLTLLISCTGVFLPLEVALNQVWGVTTHRSYLRNQIVSLALAMLMVVLAMTSLLINAWQNVIFGTLFLHHTENVVYNTLVNSLVGSSSVMASILLFFFVYWLLPNRKLPAMAVMPAAIGTGILWAFARLVYIHVLPHLDFGAAYGPFETSVSLMMWAYISGLLMLGGAHFSATRYTLKLARKDEKERNRKEVLERAELEKAKQEKIAVKL